MPVMSHWGGYDWSGCNHVLIEIPRNMMGAPWVPYKIPWSVMMTFRNTMAICLEGWLPHLQIQPEFHNWYTLIKSHIISLLDHRSPSYPIILIHIPFQLSTMGREAQPPQPSFQVVPCPASTQLQKRKTYSTDQMHVKTWPRWTTADAGTLDTRWAGTLMAQDGPLETNGMRLKILWHFFRNHGDYWYMIVLCCIPWDCFFGKSTRNIFFSTSSIVRSNIGGSEFLVNVPPVTFRITSPNDFLRVYLWNHVTLPLGFQFMSKETQKFASFQWRNDSLAAFLAYWWWFMAINLQIMEVTNNILMICIEYKKTKEERQNWRVFGLSHMFSINKKGNISFYMSEAR